MNLLAIDTATDQCSIAVSHEKDTWLFEADAGLRHSELVMDSIDMLMRAAVLQPTDLSGILCMGGPGSFTGLRIGFSLAKGLALSLGIPFAAIPTMDCMARPFSAWSGMVMPVIDAKKSAFFCALYQNGKKLCPDMDANPCEIAAVINQQLSTINYQLPTLLTGPGAPLLHEKLGDIDSLPIINPGKNLRWGNAQTLLAMARETGIIASDNSAGPAYIRKSDAELAVSS
jgi:tRNA threonylcarbamoyladenosine biosynthesis protein TsaB